MKPYKSYPAIKSGCAYFLAAFNFAFFMAPMLLGTKTLDICGVLVVLLILLGVASAIGFISILCHEMFGRRPDAKLAIGESEVFINGKTYAIGQITAMHLQFGDLIAGLKIPRIDKAPCLLVIFFADGSCCAASDPSVLFIHHLRRLCPGASFKIDDSFSFFVKGPFFSLLAGAVGLILIKSGIWPK